MLHGYWSGLKRHTHLNLMTCWRDNDQHPQWTKIEMHSERLHNQIALWRNGIGQELGFWERWMQSRGLEWPEDFQQRLVSNTPLLHEVARRLPLGVNEPVVLDVGSGPLSKIGRTVDEVVQPRIIACDPLMNHYLRLLHENGLSPLTECLEAPAEDLSAYFPPNFADVVHCSNALDHSFDPIRGIEEMLYVAKPGASVVLLHATNEAENENYEGFHQWNFDADSGRFIIWNKQTRIDANDHFAKYASTEASRSHDGRGVSAILTKREQGTPELTRLCDERGKQRIIDLYRALMFLL